MENKFEDLIMRERIIREFLDKYFLDPKKHGSKKQIEIKREEIDEVMVNSGETLEGLLIEIGKRGYLFHGTNEGDLKIIEPRVASDLNKTPENIQKEIYATNIPAIAMFHAILNCSKKSKKFDYRWGFSGNLENYEIKFLADQETLQKMSDGYLYFFESNKFRKGEGVQFISEKSQIPVCKILIRKEDFKHKIEII